MARPTEEEKKNLKITVEAAIVVISGAKHVVGEREWIKWPNLQSDVEYHWLKYSQLIGEPEWLTDDTVRFTATIKKLVRRGVSL